MLDNPGAAPQQSRFRYWIAGLAAALAFGPALSERDAEPETSPQSVVTSLAVPEIGPPPAHSVFLGFAPQLAAPAARAPDMSPLHLARHNRPLELAADTAAPISAAEFSAAAAFVVAFGSPVDETPTGAPERARPPALRMPDPSPIVFDLGPNAISLQIAALAAPPADASPAVGDVAPTTPNVAAPRQRARLARQAPNRVSARPVVTPALQPTRRTRIAATWRAGRDEDDRAGMPSPVGTVAAPAALPSHPTDPISRSLSSEAAPSVADRRPLEPAAADGGDPVLAGLSPVGMPPIVIAALRDSANEQPFRFSDGGHGPSGHRTPFADPVQDDFRQLADLPVTGLAEHPVMAALPNRMLGSESLHEAAPLTLGRATSDELVFQLTPEPGTASLLALGLGALALRRRRA